MYEWLKLRKYYKLDLIPYIDFIPNDLDEAKKQALDNKKECENTNKKPWKYLFAMQMYKGKIKHYDVKWKILICILKLIVVFLKIL